MPNNGVRDVAVTSRTAHPRFMSTGVTFSRATNADSPVAQEIVGEALDDHGLGRLLNTSDKDLLDLEGHHDARGGVFELTHHHSIDGPVGVLGWRPGGNGTIELKKVYLRRWHQPHRSSEQNGSGRPDMCPSV